MSNKDLMAQLDKLPPEKREALLKKLKAKKAQGQLGTKKTTQAPIPTLARGQENRFAQSFAQQRLWFLYQLDDSTAFYNLATALELEGSLDRQAMQRAIDEVVQRHEILRTTFGEDGNDAYQQVHEQLAVTLAYNDIRDLDDASKSAQLAALTTAEAQTLFNLEQGPLLKMAVVQTDSKRYRLLITMHHIIADGWSALKFTQELSTLYACFCQDMPSPLAPMGIQFADFSVWQRDWLSGELYEQQLAYWQQHLNNPPALELPCDKPRPAVQTFNGRIHNLELSRFELEQLESFSRSHKTTLFVTLQALFYTLLHRYSQQHDIVIGTPIANRTRTELEPLIGFFVNTLALRTSTDEDTNFAQLIDQVKTHSIEAQSNQDMPFDRIIDALKVTRDPSRSPLFQAFFSLDKGAMQDAIELPNLTARFENADINAAKFDLSLVCNQHKDGIQCQFEYNTDLFEDSSIVRMSEHFHQLMQAALKSPQTKLGELPMLSTAESLQLLATANQTLMAYPKDKLIHELIEASAEQYGANTAVSFGDQSLSYEQLNARANQLAQHLIATGAETDSLVGVCLERGIDMLVSLLAVLKAGCAYVPIDPEYPQERTEYVIASAQLNLLITQSSLLSKLPQGASTAICIDQETDQINALASDNFIRKPAAKNPMAYAIYTSGSTGKPKGVAIPHQAFVNFLVAMKAEVELQADDKLLAVTTLSFDIAGLELFLPLLIGAEVVIASREQAMDDQALADLITQHQISCLQATPATWHLLVNSDWQAPTNLARPFKGLCGGEPLPPKLANELTGRQVDLYNVYGPTETTVWSTVKHINAPVNSSTVSIGHPIGNTSVFILDAAMQPVPAGISGELWIGGDGVALGYLGRQDLTDAAFIPNPFIKHDPTASEKIYRTGDLARYLPNGELECLGRIDNQVKVRGFRIELGDVETPLNQIDSVKDGVVHALKHDDGNASLVAYIIAKDPEQTPNTSDIQAHLRQQLPEYMVPSAIVVLEQFPLTPNGKVDRKSLPKPSLALNQLDDYVAPSNDTEQQIAEVWQQVLAVDNIGIHSSFFEIGGHSLIATRVMSRISENFELDLPVRTIFEIPTISGLADLIQSLKPDLSNLDESEDDDDDFEEGIL